LLLLISTLELPYILMNCYRWTTS